MINPPYQQILAETQFHPILFDIGASGSTPSIWKPIAHHSIYVGFDPDLRDLREISDGTFFKGTIVNKAITSEPEQNEGQFYFTRSPYCSSTLHPDNAALSNYLFAGLFDVVGQDHVPTATLDTVVTQLDLPGIDWIKTDTQGTDLRIFNSLNEPMRSHVLAVDVEPGLIDAYQGEDLFVDTHRDLVQQGFWLSEATICGTQRVSQTALSHLLAHKTGITYNMIQWGVRTSPCWCEARYLRSIEWLTQHNLPQRAYVLLWVFALIDGQPGYALDVALAYEQVFGKDSIAETMQQKTRSILQRTIWQALFQKALLRLARRFLL
jgi:hypothetical protein